MLTEIMSYHIGMNPTKANPKQSDFTVEKKKYIF